MKSKNKHINFDAAACVDSLFCTARENLKENKNIIGEREVSFVFYQIFADTKVPAAQI